MTITLDTPILVSRTITGFTVQSTSDSAPEKRVNASVRVIYSDSSSHVRDLTLWTGDAYDAAGQWTDDDSKARIIELLTPVKQVDAPVVSA